MRKTSEWVSLGHPDKMADYISSFILDRYLERDPMTRYALEVQIKDNFVTLGGEITSQANFTEDELALFVKIAVAQIGYTKCYQNIWGAENTICDQDLIVTQHIGQQSPDIAQGVDASGWGDQGIFWGMAVNDPTTYFMPKDHFLARKIGQQLYDIKYAGLDIKTQVTLFDDEPEEIVVAIPMLPKHSEQDIINAVKFCCDGKTNYKLAVNGTGKFVKHGPIGDCGTTGRKLAVDFYGGNCRIGGGSPWTKDGSKADLTLNLLAREKALEFLKKHPDIQEVHCSIACRIGSPEIIVSLYDGHLNELTSYRETVDPAAIIDRFFLRKPRFAQLCRNGLLS